MLPPLKVQMYRWREMVSINIFWCIIKTVGHTAVFQEDVMECDLRLQPIAVVHGVGGCRGIIVPIHLFVTSERKLRILGVCDQCNKDCYEDLSLSDLAAHCPEPPISVVDMKLTAQDRAYLREMDAAFRIPQIAPS